MKVSKHEQRIVNGLVNHLFLAGGLLFKQTEVHGMEFLNKVTLDKGKRNRYAQLALNLLRKQKRDWHFTCVAFRIEDGEEKYAIEHLGPFNGTSIETDILSDEEHQAFINKHDVDSKLVNYAWVCCPGESGSLTDEAVVEWMMYYKPFDVDRRTEVMLHRHLGG